MRKSIQITLVAYVNGISCNEQCPHLRVRQYGRDVGYRCNYYDTKLAKDGYPHTPAYRCDKCMEEIK